MFRQVALDLQGNPSTERIGLKESRGHFLLADAEAAEDAVQDVMGRLGVSERRACKVLRQSRATQRYLPLVRDDEGALTQRIIELAAVYGRYGTPRITALLRNEGMMVNHKRVERIWKAEGTTATGIWIACTAAVALVGGRTHDRTTTHAGAALAGVDLRARVVIVAAGVVG